MGAHRFRPRLGTACIQAVQAGCSSRALVLPLVLISLGLAGEGLRSGRAAVIGAAAAKPMPEAIQRTRAAANAILEKSGTEPCLMGKLTNALLGLSSSCEASGLHSPLCRLADEVVVTTGWSMPFMESTARRLLELSATP